MKQTIDAYNVLVGALDHATKEGTFNLEEMGQIIPALNVLSDHMGALAQEMDETTPETEEHKLGPTSVGP